MNLIIDAGNTKIKIGVFNRLKLIEKHSVMPETLDKTLPDLIKKHPINHAIISATGKLKKKDLQLLKKTISYVEVSAKLHYPFKNLYKTPETLGADRYALMTAAITKYPNTNVLVIDAGTCITYDFMNSKGQYEGGAISPGIKTRYTSLNTLTANLPLLDAKEINFVAGRSTNESIHSGIINGVTFEIDAVINHYKTLTPHLTVILTGGDANFLANRLKNTIFATSNFLLEGLNFLLEINVSK